MQRKAVDRKLNMKNWADYTSEDNEGLYEDFNLEAELNSPAVDSQELTPPESQLVQSLKQQLEEAKTTAEKAQTDLQEQIHTNKDLQQQMKEQEERLAWQTVVNMRLEETHKLLKTDLEEKVHTNKDLQEQMKKQEERLARQTVVNMRLEETNKLLKTDLEEKVHTNNDLQQQLAKEKENQAQQNAMYKQLQETKHAVVSRQLEEAKTLLKSTADNYQGQIQTNHELLEKFTKENEKQQAQQHALYIELGDTKISLEKAQNNLMKQRRVSSDLRRKLKTQKEKLDQQAVLITQLEEAKKSLEETEDKLNEQLQTNCKLQQQLEKEREEKQAQQNVADKKLEEARAAVQKVQEHVHQQIQANNALQDQLKKEEEQKNTLQTVIKTQMEDVKTMQTQVQDLQGQVQANISLSQELKTEQEEKQAFQTQVKELEQMLKKEKSLRNTEHNTFIAVIKKCKIAYDTAQTEKENLSKKWHDTLEELELREGQWQEEKRSVLQATEELKTTLRQTEEQRQQTEIRLAELQKLLDETKKKKWFGLI